MPRYVYRCAKGHEREESRSIEDRDVPIECWKCPQEQVRGETGDTTLYRQPRMTRVLTFASFRI